MHRIRRERLPPDRAAELWIAAIVDFLDWQPGASFYEQQLQRGRQPHHLVGHHPPPSLFGYGLPQLDGCRLLFP